MLAMTTTLWIGLAIVATAMAVALLYLVRWLRSDRDIVNAFRQAAEGDFDGAVARLRRAAAEDDVHGVRLEALGFLYFQRARWAEAAEAFGQSAERNAGRMVRRVYQGHAMARSGRPDEAMSMLEGLSIAAPQDVSPVCGMALVLVEKGEVAAAAELYWKARQILQQYAGRQTSDGMGLLEQCAETISRSVALEPQASIASSAAIQPPPNLPQRGGARGSHRTTPDC